MFCLHIRCAIVPEKVGEFREIALKLMEETCKEPGCLSYEIGEEEPGIVAWIERWESEEALELHKSTPHFLESEKLMNGFFSSPVERWKLAPFE